MTPASRDRLARLAAVLLLGSLSGCALLQPPSQVAYRDAMRSLVRDLGDYARARHPGFLVVPQNGHELLTTDGEPDGPFAHDYLAAIDGQAREDLFYGYLGDGVATPAGVREAWRAALRRARDAGLPVLVTDYAATPAHADDAYARAAADGFVSFVAHRRALDAVPPYPAPPPGLNPDPVRRLEDVRSFLYLINPARFPDRAAYLDALRAAPHDLLIIDAYDEHGRPLAADEVASLQRKPGGAPRLVLAYFSIGEAEDYRAYWQRAWDVDPPAWLGAENPAWPGNYAVRYWMPGWHEVLYGSPDASLDSILSAGFDGVYLDRVDAFDAFERAAAGF